ncbi:alcohol dehydrogenase catalytic domain-containing protein [Actinomadura barringtoniae]|uniref:Alcohol dehydrogenase catalytic domain-containing protein n=1 Tax=Actinomadura barringtoniae TaxID=1427535 RepID=A0A939PA16_9ACTN|nr:alcohol dehydrogenase catalytic domain-containing protein [Actinomadura barringtoniae]MBO2448603.1 alcohol dehydrogenase catalytic domain-containing protein [Actinomadura barringtoniae]
MDDWPEPSCGPDEVIVTIQGVGLCGSDLAVVSGNREVPALPWVLGHEACGVIVATGDDVAHRFPGQRVVVEPNYPCLACGFCRSGVTAGCRNRRAVGISEPGLLAERVAVPARFTWPVPETWDVTDVVCVEPFTVALNAVRMSGLTAGDTCLVVGAGSQGLLVLLAVLHAGGVPFVVDPHVGRSELAFQMGAQDPAVLPPDATFPAVIETSGAPEAFEHALERTAPGGTLIAVGQSTRPAGISTFLLVQRRLTVRGCLIYDHPAGFAHTIATLGEHDLRPGRVLRERFDLAQAPKAFAQAADIAGKTWISLPRNEEMAR